MVGLWLLFGVVLFVYELLLAVVGARAQGVTLAVEPAGPPLTVKPTVPEGALLVPLEIGRASCRERGGMLAGVDGGQSNVVCVDRAMTWTISVPLLPAWTDSVAGV